MLSPSPADHRGKIWKSEHGYLCCHIAPIKDIIHARGVRQFGMNWLHANERAAQALRQCGLNPQDYDTVLPMIILAVMKLPIDQVTRKLKG